MANPSAPNLSRLPRGHELPPVTQGNRWRSLRRGSAAVCAPGLRLRRLTPEFDSQVINLSRFGALHGGRAVWSLRRHLFFELGDLCQEVGDSLRLVCLLRLQHLDALRGFVLLAL